MMNITPTGTKSILLWTLVFLVAATVLIEYHFFRFYEGFDVMRQIVGSKQLLLGNGINRPELNPNDLSQPHYIPISEFPPGFSILFAPFLALFGNLHIAHGVFAMTNVAVLFIMVRVLFRELSLPKTHLLFPLFVLYLTFDGTVANYAASTDVVCLNLFLGAAIFFMRYGRSGKPGHLIAACALSALTIYFRYAYLPFLLLVPMALLYRNCVFTRRLGVGEALKAGMINLILSLPLAIAYIKGRDNVAYMADKTGQGQFHFENLLYINPFPFEAIFKTIPVLRFMGFDSSGYDRGYEYPYSLHVLFFAVSAIILFPLIRRYVLSFRVKGMANYFTQFALVASVGLVSFLIVLTILNDSQRSDFNWTWLRLLRYFIVPVFCIQVGYFILLALEKNRFIRWFAVATLLAGFTFSVAHKMILYSSSYAWFDFKRNSAILKADDAQLNTYWLYGKLIERKTPYTRILVAPPELSTQYSMLDQILGSADVVHMDTDTWKRGHWETSNPVEFVFLHPPSEVSELQNGIMPLSNRQTVELDNGHSLSFAVYYPLGKN